MDKPFLNLIELSVLTIHFATLTLVSEFASAIYFEKLK